jgi:serine/threonine protein kinase
MTDKSDNSLMQDKSGTVGYLAPEIIAKESKNELYDDRVDVFSAGIVFFELVTGINPFKAPNYKESMLLNYKCEINFSMIDKLITKDTLEFVK